MLLSPLTWNLPVSALAWARVQGQSMISLRKFGSWFSSLSHAKHLSRAQAAESCRNFSSRCQARAWSSVHTACTFLNETHDKHPHFLYPFTHFTLFYDNILWVSILVKPLVNRKNNIFLYQSHALTLFTRGHVSSNIVLRVGNLTSGLM